MEKSEQSRQRHEILFLRNEWGVKGACRLNPKYKHKPSPLCPLIRWQRCVKACPGLCRFHCCRSWQPSSWNRWCAVCPRSAVTYWRKWCATERWTSSTLWCSGSGRPWRSSLMRNESSSCASFPDARGCPPTQPTSLRGFRSWKWTGWVNHI